MKRNPRIKSVVLSTIFICTQSVLLANYFNDFEGSVGSEWSRTNTDVTPIGNRSFLGQFGNGTVSLNLTDLEDHSSVSISFDLFIIRTWDGNVTASYLGQALGPDIWSLGVRDGESLLYTTFSNNSNRTQAYPDSYPDGVYDFFTGATEIKTLGFMYYAGSIQDSVYHLSYTFPHTESSLILDFSAMNLQSLSDESWGLDNVSVTLIPEPCTIALVGFGSFLLNLKRKK